MFKIGLEDMHFKAYHGYYQQEQKIGGEYLVSVDIWINVDIQKIDDDLELTVNYENIFAICRNAMAHRRKLIETVAAEIGKNVMDLTQDIHKASITIKKLNPPLSGTLKNANIELTLDRQSV